jgi:hypothetical protein
MAGAATAAAALAVRRRRRPRKTFLSINSPVEGRAGLAHEKLVTILDVRKRKAFLGRRGKGRIVKCPSPS